MPAPIRSVLFACTLNAVRSPMAAAILIQLAGNTLRVDSAGVEAGNLDPLAVEVMREIGIALDTHAPRELTGLDTREYDLVIALSAPAKTRTEFLARGSALAVEYWPVTDPTRCDGSREQRLAAYRQVRDELMGKLKSRFLLAPA